MGFVNPRERIVAPTTPANSNKAAASNRLRRSTRREEKDSASATSVTSPTSRSPTRTLVIVPITGTPSQSSYRPE
jgi:hypothetical protein